MNALYKYSPKTRLVAGVFALALGLLLVFTNDFIFEGFPKGFFGGIFVGLGIGLVVTHINNIKQLNS